MGASKEDFMEDRVAQGNRKAVVSSWNPTLDTISFTDTQKNRKLPHGFWAKWDDNSVKLIVGNEVIAERNLGGKKVVGILEWCNTEVKIQLG